MNNQPQKRQPWSDPPWNDPPWNDPPWNDPPWNDPRITAYATGEMSNAESAEFESEMKLDRSLDGAVQQAKRVASQLEQHFASEPIPASVVRSSNSSASNRINWLAMALAASLIFVFAALVLPAIRRGRELASKGARGLADDAAVRQEAMSDRSLPSPGEVEALKFDSVDAPMQASVYRADEKLDPMMAPKLRELRPNQAEPDFSRQRSLEMDAFGASVDQKKYDRPGPSASSYSMSVVEVDESTAYEAEADKQAADQLAAGIVGRGNSDAVQSRLRSAAPPQPSGPAAFGSIVNSKAGVSHAGDSVMSDAVNSAFAAANRPQNKFFKVVQNANTSIPIGSNAVDGLQIQTIQTEPEMAESPDRSLRSAWVAPWINHFQYNYNPMQPSSSDALAVDVELTDCPWDSEHQIIRIGIFGREKLSSEIEMLIAKEVDVRVDFNPNVVAEYRLLSYESRVLDDTNLVSMDVGNFANHNQVTAIYEWIAVREESESLSGDSGKSSVGDQAVTIKIRYKRPTDGQTVALERSISNESMPYDQSSLSTRLALTVAGAAMYADAIDGGNEPVWGIDAIKHLAESSVEDSLEKTNFVEMLEMLKRLR